MTYIVNYMRTAAWTFIEGRMQPYDRSLCTPELNQVVRNELLTSGFLEAFGS